MYVLGVAGKAVAAPAVAEEAVVSPTKLILGALTFKVLLEAI